MTSLPDSRKGIHLRPKVGIEMSTRVELTIQDGQEFSTIMDLGLGFAVQKFMDDWNW